MKDNFSTQSDNYVQYRPTYPAELFDYLNTLVTNKESKTDTIRSRHYRPKLENIGAKKKRKKLRFHFYCELEGSMKNIRPTTNHEYTHLHRPGVHAQADHARSPIPKPISHIHHAPT